MLLTGLAVKKRSRYSTQRASKYSTVKGFIEELPELLKPLFKVNLHTDTLCTSVTGTGPARKFPLGFRY
jgi:hypothetical protein